MMTACLNQDTFNLNELRLQSRNNLLFVAGATAVISGLFLPNPVQLTDMLVVFAVSLTAAVLVISLLSRRISELNGFPLLVVLTVCTQMTAAIAVSKSLILDGSAGIMLTNIAKVNLIGRFCSTIFTATIFGGLAIVLFITIFRIVRTIHQKNADLLEDVIALKQAYHAGDTYKVVIDSDKLNEQRKAIEQKTNFFLAILAVAKFILCSAVIQLLVSSACLLGTAISLISQSSLTAINPKDWMNFAATSSFSMLFLAFLVTVTIAHLLKKIGPTAFENDSIPEHQFEQRIKVAAREIVSSYSSEPITIAIDNLYQEPSAELIELVGNYDTTFWSASQIDNEDAYKETAELLANRDGKTILMAANNTGYLPVTIPVNIAIHLAKQNNKVLLIDCDFERQAVLQVFDINHRPSKPISTCIGNLWIAPADTLRNFHKDHLDKFVSGYNNIIIYMPKLQNSTLTKNLAHLVQSVMLFGQTEIYDHSDMKQCFEAPDDSEVFETV